MENFHLNYDLGKLIKEGEYYCYGCEYYSLLEHVENRMALLAFREEINSYAHVPARQELVVGLASREEIVVVDYNHFMLKRVVRLETPLRNLVSFCSASQEYLVLMPYENYIILYNLTAGNYCKLRGHKSFVANAAFSAKDGRIITAGMDHRICFSTLSAISPTSWIPVLKDTGNNIRIK